MSTSSRLSVFLTKKPFSSTLALLMPHSSSKQPSLIMFCHTLFNWPMLAWTPTCNTVILRGEVSSVFQLSARVHTNFKRFQTILWFKILCFSHSSGMVQISCGTQIKKFCKALLPIGLCLNCLAWHSKPSTIWFQSVISTYPHIRL